MSVASNIKRIADEKGMKYCALAEKIGFSPNKFSSMLNGRYIAKADEIPKICVALDVTPNEIFRITDNRAS